MSSKDKYLGFPLIVGHSKQEAFKSIKESFETRLSTWSAINLSQVGKGTMIKHVLNSIPVYQMGTFKLPDNLISQLTTIERKFFRGHKTNRGSNPIAWQNLCVFKDFGGLAFRDLEKLNLDLLTKLAWRICTESSHLMVQILSSKYFKTKDILHQNIEAKNCSFTWNGITKGLKIVQPNYFMEVNNGEDTKIWQDKWISGSCKGIKGSYENGVLSAEAGECMAVREALSWAKEKRLNHIHIEADAKLVIQSITGRNLLIQWENRNIIKEIKNLMSCFSSCIFRLLVELISSC
ncbi:uncharacterized protein LOC113309224 [Papaver somniferum]|uniref:uncharacterized protein LOC113309224 n=1 Tax=Papaver somniferum TaxID=3469 RepID=UPI000E6F4C28|nr:uncharacterized protein LOC113309224 [Papaver somniferum]